MAKNIHRYYPILSFIAITIAIDSSVVHALTGSYTAAVTFISPPTVTELQSASMGNVVIPASGSSTYTIATDSSTSTGGGGEFVGGTQQEGIFDIGGDTSVTSDVSVAFVSSACGSGNASLTAFTTDLDGTTGGASQTGVNLLGPSTLIIGSTMTVNNTASEGACNQTYSVTVTYN